MANPEEEHEMLWLDETDEDPDSAGQGSSAPQPDALETAQRDLDHARRDLAELRKELAVKTVQLASRQAASQQKDQLAVAELAQELASQQVASLSAEKEQQLGGLVSQVQNLTAQMEGMEVTRSQREEELDELKRLAASQKRALREAAALQGEREAVDQAAVEAHEAVAGQAVEDELERLAAELAATRTRAELESQSREAELSAVRAQLAGAQGAHNAALVSAEAALSEAWDVEAARMQAASETRVANFEAEVAQLRGALDEARFNSQGTALLGELAELNNAKVQVQREFEAFKDMATQAARGNREEVSRLLEEVAGLRAQSASFLQSASASSFTGGSLGYLLPAGSTGLDMLSDQPPGVMGYTAHAYQAAHDALGGLLHRGMMRDDALGELMRRVPRLPKHTLPFFVLLALVVLILFVAVIRAALATRSQHAGPLCFMQKLGITVGTGCGVTSEVQDADAKIKHILDNPQRVHDVVGEIRITPNQEPATTTSSTSASTAAMAAAATIEAAAAVEAALIEANPDIEDAKPGAGSTSQLRPVVTTLRSALQGPGVTAGPTGSVSRVEQQPSLSDQGTLSNGTVMRQAAQLHGNITVKSNDTAASSTATAGAATTAEVVQQGKLTVTGNATTGTTAGNATTATIQRRALQSSSRRRRMTGARRLLAHAA